MLEESNARRIERPAARLRGCDEAVIPPGHGNAPGDAAVAWLGAIWENGRRSGFAEFHPFAYGFFVGRNQMVVSLRKGFLQAAHHGFDRHIGAHFQ